MPIYDNNGTTNYEIGKLYDNNGTTNYQIGKVYDNDGTASHLIYQAQSDTYTITATTQRDGVAVKSNIITNTGNYEKMVIESVSASGGNYGQNTARLYCNGVNVLYSGNKYDPSSYVNAVHSWSGTFAIAQGGSVYVEVWTDKDENRDDYDDPTSATVKFHFE